MYISILLVLAYCSILRCYYSRWAVACLTEVLNFSSMSESLGGLKQNNMPNKDSDAKTDP